MATRQYFQVILVCLKQFSLINEKFSYKKGDEFLYNIARELDHILPGAKAFRFGNVEFAVLLPFETEEKASERLKKLQERFEERWELGSLGSYIQAYFTDVIYRGQKWKAAQMIEYLESGLQYAKKEPGGLRRFDEKLLEQLNRRKRMMEIMETSIRQRRFKVWYQPVFNLKTSRFSSAEALLRLRDYDGEPISPSEFIPLAEETGLIDDLSWIVLEEVCMLLGQMGDKIDSVSINLSMQQFEDRNLSGRIHECLNRSGLSPDKLKIEVTERVLLQDMDYMKMIMEEMTGEGFGFYLDDFGTGYSNISCALSLPFEYIKLDRSLLVRLPGDRKAQVFVRSMIETFHAMGQKIVAEGVEEEEQIELLRQFGVDCVQGYYYGKPMPEDEFKAAIAKGWEEQRK
ncbi:MAG: GGDEF domain-containing phosphodiesterase [Clostridia bacterium]|nr:GGDEF domain-containing phosphodiesterase [Clostridia bacterium]